MADALTTAAVTAGAGAAGITLASLFPELDLKAVVGAFGGSFFFILWAKDISIWQRLGYLFVGWIGGYFGAAEFMSRKWTETSGLASFGAGLLCVLICISLSEAVQTGRPPKWLLFVMDRFMGKRKPE